MIAQLVDITGQSLREPTVFKRAAGSSGTVALWTPASGKRFRLLKYLIEVTSNVSVSAAGAVSLSFQDGSNTIFGAHSFYAPTSAVTTGAGLAYSTGVIDLGRLGIVSAAQNNVLNLVIGQALLTASVIAHAWGVEES